MDGLILLTGATGYVGGRLLAALEGRGARLRALARRADALRTRVAAGTEVIEGDCLDPASLARAMTGVHTACYFVHSMGATGDFARLDREAARNFGEAARAAGVRRIVYLGGLGDGAERLSAHLASRHETGDLLRASGVPVIELRASIVIGTGSLSFEMVRALVERLPVMICPRWVGIEAQPIAIDDVVAYLVASIDRPDGPSATFEIGGPDVVSYGDIMREYARQRGLRRLFITVPLLTPRLSSLWLGLVTPLYARVGRKLISSIRNATVVRDAAALRAFDVRPRPLSVAIAGALATPQSRATRWSDARSAGGLRPRVEVSNAPLLVDRREVNVAASPADAFRPIRRIGGARGWYWGTVLWRIRGAIDLLAGGVGMRRGRRDPEHLVPGDALDFWRVESFEADRRLRLEAEMKVPGRAWLEFDVEPSAGGLSRIRQTASFAPSGVAGRLYWYALLPIHALIFRGLLRAIVRQATGPGERAAPSAPGPKTTVGPGARPPHRPDGRDDGRQAAGLTSLS